MATIGASEIQSFEEIIQLASQFDSLDAFIAAYPDLALYAEQSTLEGLIEYFGWAEAYQQASISDFEAVVAANEFDLVAGFTSAVSETSKEASDYVDDAATAYQNYVASGGAPPTGGPPPVYTWSGGAVATALGYRLCQLLSVAAPALMCGMAAIMGYDVGTSIYEENPEFAQAFFETIAPWSFDAIDKFIGIDYGPRTYVDSRVFEAAKYYLENVLVSGFIITDAIENQVLHDWMVNNHIIEVKYNEGADELMPVVEGDATFNVARVNVDYGGRTNHVTWKYIRGSGYIDAPGTYLYHVGSVQYVLYASNPGHFTIPGGDDRDGYCYYNRDYTQYRTYEDYLNDTNGRHVTLPEYGKYVSLISQYTRDNKTVLYLHNTAQPIFANAEVLYGLMGPELSSTLTGALAAEIAWNMIYGNTAITQGAEGVSKWQGQAVSDPYDGAIDVVTDATQGTTVPYIPISLPSQGAERLDPTTNPNPQQYTNPSGQVQPYAQTETLPLPQIKPQTDVSSNPETNPSQSTENRPSTDVPSQSKSTDAGQSPTIPPNVTPPIFSPGSSNPSGLINVYNPTPAQLYSFGNWLWVTYRDVTIQKVINNPFDGVISLHEVYFTPVTGVSQEIRSGFLSSGVYADTVPQRYSQLNCGSIVIPEWYGNYLDYSPYTKVYIYLPFIGVQELDCDDVIGAAVNVTYGLDSYSGACTAMITTAKDGYNAVTYQFTGNASVQHPISGGSQAQTFIAQMMGVGSVLGGIATGGLAGGVIGAAEGLLDVTKVKSSVSHSGTFTGNYGAMGIKTPYIIVKRPNQVVVPNYNEFYGYPAHKYVVIGSCTGYLRCKEVHVNSARATDEEKARIEELLKAGVYVS